MMKNVVSKVVNCFLMTAILPTMITTVVEAQPAISVGHWDVASQSVTYVYHNDAANTYTWNLEDFTKDTLPNEWYPSDPSEALMSGALLIRTGGNYYYFNPESAYVSNSSGRSFNLRDSTYAGWSPGSQSKSGNSNSNTQVNNTVGRVIYQSGSRVYTPFNNCVQAETVTLNNQGYNHTSILLSSSVGIFSASSKYGCNSQYEPYLPNLAFATAY
jgi:hypothetical protein